MENTFEEVNESKQYVQVAKQNFKSTDSKMQK